MARKGEHKTENKALLEIRAKRAKERQPARNWKIGLVAGASLLGVGYLGGPAVYDYAVNSVAPAPEISAAQTAKATNKVTAKQAPVFKQVHAVKQNQNKDNGTKIVVTSADRGLIAFQVIKKTVNEGHLLPQDTEGLLSPEKTSISARDAVALLSSKVTTSTAADLKKNPRLDPKGFTLHMPSSQDMKVSNEVIGKKLVYELQQALKKPNITQALQEIKHDLYGLSFYASTKGLEAALNEMSGLSSTKTTQEITKHLRGQLEYRKNDITIDSAKIWVSETGRIEGLHWVGTFIAEAITENGQKAKGQTFLHNTVTSSSLDRNRKMLDGLAPYSKSAKGNPINEATLEDVLTPTAADLERWDALSKKASESSTSAENVTASPQDTDTRARQLKLSVALLNADQVAVNYMNNIAKFGPVSLETAADLIADKALGLSAADSLVLLSDKIKKQTSANSVANASGFTFHLKPPHEMKVLANIIGQKLVSEITRIIGSENPEKAAEAMGYPILGLSFYAPLESLETAVNKLENSQLTEAGNILSNLKQRISERNSNVGMLKAEMMVNKTGRIYGVIWGKGPLDKISAKAAPSKTPTAENFEKASKANAEAATKAPQPGAKKDEDTSWGKTLYDYGLSPVGKMLFPSLSK